MNTTNTTNTTNATIINENDSVGVALADLAAGAQAAGVTLVDDIPQGHKFARADIRAGAHIIKYGNPIGSATCDIPAGAHVHVHNVRTNLKDVIEYTYKPKPSIMGEGGEEAPPRATRVTIDHFMGYAGEYGTIGTRNEIWVIPTVGCVNKTAEKLAEAGRRRYKETYAFTHPYGCSQVGEDQERTQNLLANLVMHPNAGGVLIVGLGCENNHVEEFKRVLALRYKGCEKMFGGRVRFLVAQDSADEFAEGEALLDGLAAEAERRSRIPFPLSKLCIGLKCGGSDGLSGITANPLVGAVSDRIVRNGGTTILTEVPEMFGAEHILMNRCENEALFGQTVALINDFKNYYISHGQEIYENPSPGNKDGGISTLEDKSLGCTQKGGKSPVRAVLRYGDTAAAHGLNLLEAPGNDLIAITALTCAGAQIILFTTGRGTPLGAPVPTLKIASNTRLASKKPGWIDFDAGRLVSGEAFDALADALYSDVIAVASGEAAAKNEANGYREIALFKDGVIL
ncbi:MAG: altronate dehydratase family protein [Oscillospiraceae bacterium]|nr:altronate dehydratase family protein [Oscillospiraceae bacterium]